MKIEILYGELANLLGEHGTQMLLSETFGEARIVRTPFPAQPAFMTDDIDFVYMGPMTERTQRLVLDRWRPWASAFRDAIERDVTFFFVGNAMDLVGRTIRYEDGPTVEALGLFPFDTTCRRYDRDNAVVRGVAGDIDVMGFRSQWTEHTGDAGAHPLIDITYGHGMNPDTQAEGIRYRRFLATDLLGPFLIMNPAFTRRLFQTLGHDGPLPHQAVLEKAAEARMRDFDRSFQSWRKSRAAVRAFRTREQRVLEASKTSTSPSSEQ
ncbi:MAG: hypothetical protein ACOYH4_06245 [Saccharofermentanales bacterium]|jgi:CobQ-like glutamine amidotransferase family enzyme